MEDKTAPLPLFTQLAAQIVAAYVANNQMERGALPELIASVAGGLSQTLTGGEPVPEEKPLVPAVSVKKSVTDDFIICLEDGKKFKSLKRHLMTHYALSPDDYRQKWGLPRDYPMVAPSYAATRSALAQASGLGRKRKAEPAETIAEEPAKPAPKRRAPRKAKQAA